MIRAPEIMSQSLTDWQGPANSPQHTRPVNPFPSTAVAYNNTTGSALIALSTMNTPSD